MFFLGVEAQKCLHNLKPCYVRVSGGRKGFHVLKFCNDGVWAEEVWDDLRQRLINEIRARCGLAGDILFDIKSYRNITRVAGKWQEINDGYDVEMFLLPEAARKWYRFWVKKVDRFLRKHSIRRWGE